MRVTTATPGSSETADRPPEREDFSSKHELLKILLRSAHRPVIKLELLTGLKWCLASDAVELVRFCRPGLRMGRPGSGCCSLSAWVNPQEATPVVHAQARMRDGSAEVTEVRRASTHV